MKMGTESLEATMRKSLILFAVFVARMEDTKLPKCVMFGELVGSTGCVGGQERECMGCCFLDAATRGGIFHGEIYRCRESQGWTGLQHAVLLVWNVTGRTKERI